MVEGLEIAYAEVASTPEKQVVVRTAPGVDNVAATPLKRVQIRICAGLSVLAIVIVIVAVVATLETRAHRSMSGSNKEATIAPTSGFAFITTGPTLTASGPISPSSDPTLTVSSVSVTRDAGMSKSTFGAYNGTGLCVNRGCNIQVLLFYQHYAGAIRASRLPVNGMWQPYDPTQDLLVASGARNGTPLASVTYGISGASMWQVFYVDSLNKLRDTIHQEGTGFGRPGLLAKADVQVSQTTNTGLAVSYGSLYSDNPANGTGYLLFYGGIDNLVHVITWHERNESWTDEFTFPESNGNAGFSSFLNGSTSYLILVNLVGYLEIWWRDFDPQNNSTSMWNRGELVVSGIIPTPGDKLLMLLTGSISNVALRPNTSVIFDQAGFCYAQYANNTFAAIVTWTDNSGLLASGHSTPVDSIEGIPGSGITLFTSSEGDNGQTSMSIFVQVNGSDITQVQQLRSGGPWEQYTLPVY